MTSDSSSQRSYYDGSPRRYGRRSSLAGPSNHRTQRRRVGRSCQLAARLTPGVTVGIVGDEVVVAEVPVGKVETFGVLVRRLHTVGIDRIVIERGVENGELAGFVHALGSEAARTGETTAPDASPSSPSGHSSPFPSFPHIRVGRIQVEDRVVGNLGEMSTIRRLYTDAVSAASVVWENASKEQKPDADAAGAMIDGLAQAVSENRTALIALTALKNTTTTPSRTWSTSRF